MPVTALPPLPGDDSPAPGPGSGFRWGGCWDAAQPGPLLAAAAAAVWQQGLAQRADDDLMGVLMAARRLGSWSAAMELAAAGELAARRSREAAVPGGPRDGGHVEDEIAAALALTQVEARQLMELSAAVHRLPATAAALRAGGIDLPRAAVIASELCSLSDTDAAAVDRELAGQAGDLSTGQLRATARQQAMAIAPGSAQRRREQAEARAGVETSAEPAGTSALAGRDLPPATALAADRHVSALAWALQAAGARGSADQLRAQVFAALLSGHPVSSLLTTDDPARGLNQEAG